MATNLPDSEDGDPRREWRDLVTGLAAAILLTAASFALVIFRPVSTGWLLAGLGALALLQIAAHFRYFLHVDLDRSHRDDLQLVLFTGLVVLLMVGGTMWILFSQHARMG
ncbi:cytochrome o ubiquinol oxidase subunit IV [Aurantiacibacter spongiae]|uniref:Cytochrome bo(3) ubiquinol oxidase subunit 4 n=1 Tax=Aurantiacibacter spongiae TaxID=2488860 RepID=A0A3N5CW74_9SPHN|nr:cytochrome C oxidase subunit IV family protein [Aurantiacibacter spongiae]RPF71780.1 cytochrome-c oxidase [Aurantiacibacter spongiae]